MDTFSFPYQPGSSPEPPTFPLGRYLPPVPQGMAVAWLQKHVTPGSVILDPFGSSPQVALEAARAGYRVIAACNNPVVRFMTETLAAAPQAADFKAALAELAMQKRGDDRLENVLQNLYLTDCPGCSHKVAAEAFLWRKEEHAPYAKIVHCPACLWEGEAETDEFDLQVLQQSTNDTINRARALQRVEIGDEDARQGAREALETYQPRQINFLFTLMNKIQTLNLPPEQKNLLWMLFLVLCDEANMMWSHPPGRTRPRQLSVPSEYQEVNLWLMMERTASQWPDSPGALPCQDYRLVKTIEPGITLYPGRIRDMLPLKPGMDISAVVSIFPRPNQAFWTYSALWSGWIWGTEAVVPLKSSLQRKRYGWQWHANALSSSFSMLQSHLPAGIPFWGIVAESNPGFLAAILAASENNGLEFSGLSGNEDDQVSQLWWKTAAIPQPSEEKPGLGKVIRQGFRNYLQRRAEPAGYTHLFTAGMLELVREKCLARGLRELPFNQITLLQNQFAVNFSNRSLLRRFESESQSQESGVWWLEEVPADLKPSLSDQVELAIRSIFQQKENCDFPVLLNELYESFPGLLTPSLELLDFCLESYARPLPTHPESWQIREAERIETRQADETEVILMLKDCAERVGLESFTNPHEPATVEWHTRDGELVFKFFVQSHAGISRLVHHPDHLAEQGVIVFPGSRSNLLTYKIQKNPYLEELVNTGWHFLKFRTLRSICTRPELTMTNWKELLDGDPPRWEQPQQLSFFST